MSIMLRGVAPNHAAAALALAALAACVLGGWRLRSGRGDELIGPTPAQFAAHLQAGALSQSGYLTDSEHTAGLIASEAVSHASRRYTSAVKYCRRGCYYLKSCSRNLRLLISCSWPRLSVGSRQRCCGCGDWCLLFVSCASDQVLNLLHLRRIYHMRAGTRVIFCDGSAHPGIGVACAKSLPRGEDTSSCVWINFYSSNWNPGI